MTDREQGKLDLLAKMQRERDEARAEVKRLLAERNKMLEDLESAGWPCRLVDLPLEYKKLAQCANTLREALRERDEAACLTRDGWSRTK